VGGEVRVLGPLRLSEGPDERAVGSVASARLLAALVVADGGAVATEVLSERLWGEPAPAGRLRMAVHRLRQRLEEVGLGQLLTADQGTYRLDLPADALDAARFVHLVDDAQTAASSAPERAVELLRTSLDLWRGEPYEDLADELWLRGEVERLRQQRLDAEDLLTGLLLRLRRSPPVVDLRRAAEAEPLREQRWRHLASELGRTTRRSEALRAIEDARAALGTAGLDLGAELLELEQSLLTGVSAPPAPSIPWSAGRELVGRDRELTHVRRLLRTNRIVVVTGLGGVGKSALATALGAEVEEAGVTVLRTGVDGARSRAEVDALLARTVGLAGADDPASLLDTIARRLPASALWVIDGAEADVDAVARAAEALVRAAPSLRVLVTSRTSVPVAGAAPFALEPLEVGTADLPGPAMRLLADLAGVVVEDASRADLQALQRLSERGAGLPLALEVLAGATDLVGLQIVAAGEGPLSPPVLESLRWALSAMPPACRTLLVRMAQLAAGCGPELAQRLTTSSEDLPILLAPAVQARVLLPVPDGASYRYQLPEPLRQALRDLGTPDDIAAVHEVLVGVGRAVGRLHGPADASALRLVEAELDTFRHWLSRFEGTPQGLELATALARAWQELGIGGDGATWLERQVATVPADDPTAGAARIAGGVIRGWLDLAGADLEWILPALDAVAAAGDWEAWLHGSILGALAVGRAGTDLAIGLELLTGETAQAALAAVSDPWFTVQRQAVLAMGPVGAANFGQARAYLRPVIDRFLELGDPSTALGHVAMSVAFGRIAEQWADVEADLATAAPLEALGLARGAVATLAVERAHYERERGDRAAAVRAMVEAIEGIERAGGLRHVAARRVGLAEWHLEDGRSAEALAEIRVALPTLLRHDRLGAAMALMGLVGITHGDLAAMLAGASRRRYDDRGVIALTPRRLEELQERLAAATQGREAAEARGAAMDDDELVELVDSIELR
jgi:DNA-binding SARP family transcriptional activator